MVLSLRRAAVAGSWYPAQPAALVAEMEGYLNRAQVPLHFGHVVALVAPHAGLRYSGPVAAHAYRLLMGRPRLTAVLVGPSHRMAFSGVAIMPSGEFETPLGRIAVDEELAARLLDTSAQIESSLAPHQHEHSLEMQLPFLQHAVRELKIVPLLMGEQSREAAWALAEALTTVLSDAPEAVLLASSDLSHYRSVEVANRLDAVVVDDVSRLDADGLMAHLESFPEHACGGGPMVAVMRAARALGATRATVLRHANSGDVPGGDRSHVVGYLAAAFTSAP